MKLLKTLLKTLVLLVIFGLRTESLFANSNISPDFIRKLPPLPEEAVEELKKHENFDLATGKVSKVWITDNDDIAYGITESEVEDAIRYGFLPKNATLPTKMNKPEADRWTKTVTIPTYRAIVRDVVKVELTLNQEAALTFFVQNTGRSNLEKLVNGENRLNDRNYDSVVSKMPLYYPQPKMKTRCEFQVALYKGKQLPRKS